MTHSKILIARAAMLLVLLLALLESLNAQSVNVDAAKKEGKVVVYGTLVPQVMTLIEKGFEAKYGIKIEYWRADATKVIERVVTEWRAGKPGFDVVIGARGPLALGKADGVYAKFSPSSAASFPAKFKDKDGVLNGFRVTPVVGWIDPPVSFRPDPHEVDEVFEVPLGFLLDTRNHRYESAFFKGRMRNYWAMPYGRRFIWGATAGMLVTLQRILAGTPA